MLATTPRQASWNPVDTLDSPMKSPNLSATDDNSNIQVICRFRPSLSHETRDVKVVDNETVVIAGNSFTLDRVLDADSSQEVVYTSCVQQTLREFLNGYNGTVLTYGQTGSGKSYTMYGTASEKGIIPRITDDLFSLIQLGANNIEYTVSVCYFEIYMEQIKDLLNTDSTTQFSIHEDKANGIYVKGLSQAFVSSSSELLQVLKLGLKNRAVMSTNMNFESSRSHAIFQIRLSQKNLDTETTKKSSLFLVDLAGSEKVTKSATFGQSLQEAKKINSSLSTLGLVINNLTDSKSTHVPYRDSKLTRILQESLGGNSKTTLILNCSPSSSNELETLSTLRFGSRAKFIKNKVHLNPELSVNQLELKISQLEKINEKNQEYILKLESDIFCLRNDTSKSPYWKKNSLTSPRTPSKLPVPNNLNRLAYAEELERRDNKIAELEANLLTMKMDTLKSSHQDDLKLFKLENALHLLNDKLNDVESINTNLKKHLLLSEKIIESRDSKISKLKFLLSNQQLQINHESKNFESKLLSVKDKLNDAPNVLSINTSHNQPTDDNKQATTPTSSSRRVSVSSPISPKVGFNLRIVKPLRGGGDPQALPIPE